MKYCLFTVAILTLFINTNAQSILLVNNRQSIIGNTHSYSDSVRGNGGLKAGKILMIAGGGGVVLGGLGLASGWAKTHDDGYGSSYKFATAVAAAGATSLIVGAILYISEKNSHYKTTRRVSAISGRDKIGLAYNF